jgi:hypothetical protein
MSDGEPTDRPATTPAAEDNKRPIIAASDASTPPTGARTPHESGRRRIPPPMQFSTHFHHGGLNDWLPDLLAVPESV